MTARVGAFYERRDYNAQNIPARFNWRTVISQIVEQPARHCKFFLSKRLVRFIVSRRSECGDDFLVQVRLRKLHFCIARARRVQVHAFYANYDLF